MEVETLRGKGFLMDYSQKGLGFAVGRFKGTLPSIPVHADLNIKAPFQVHLLHGLLALKVGLHSVSSHLIEWTLKSFKKSFSNETWSVFCAKFIGIYLCMLSCRRIWHVPLVHSFLHCTVFWISCPQYNGENIPQHSTCDQELILPSC